MTARQQHETARYEFEKETRRNKKKKNTDIPPLPRFLTSSSEEISIMPKYVSNNSRVMQTLQGREKMSLRDYPDSLLTRPHL